MKIWEAHRALSYAVGDGVEFLGIDGEIATPSNPPSSVPDGARFPKILRDGQIYRAMLKVYSDILMSVAPLDKLMSGTIIEKLLPNRILTEVFPASFNGGSMERALEKKVMYICNIYTRDTVDGSRGYPVPIKSAIEMNALLNLRNVQLPDAFATHYATFPIADTVSTVYLFDFKDEFANMNIYVRYLEYPRDPSLAIDGTNMDYNWNMELDIEEIFIPRVLSYAKLFALSESQDIEAMSALQMELMSQTGKGD